MSDNVPSVIDQHFGGLASLELDVLIRLALARRAISPAALDLSIVASLADRQLVETDMDTVSLPPPVLKYVLDKLIDDLASEIFTGNLDKLPRYNLLSTDAPNFITNAQIELTLHPLLKSLLHSLKSKESLRTKIQDLLNKCREDEELKNSCLAGNLLNLLAVMSPHLENLDLSELTVNMPYLQDTTLRNSNFVGCSFEQPVFSLSFGTIFSIAFSPDGQYLAFSDTKDVVHIWTADGKLLHHVCRGHTNRVYSVSFSPNSELLVSGGEDSLVIIWDVRSGTCLHSLQGHRERVWSARFSQDGNKVISSSEDGTVRIWDVKSGRLLDMIEVGNKGLRHTCGRLFGETEQLLANGPSGTVSLWNLSNHERIGEIETQAGRVRSFDLNGDSNILAVASGNLIQLWDVDSKKLRRTFVNPDGEVRSVVFHPSGRFLASSSTQGTINIWDPHAEGDECFRTLLGHKDIVWSIAFHPSGKILASAGGDYSVRLWDVESATCLKTLQGHTDFVWTGAFCLDEKSLLSGGNGGIIRLWDIETETIVSEFKEHTEFVWSVVYSPDGKIAASASDDRTIKLWDIERGVCLKTLSGHTKWVHSIAFSPDGNKLVSGSDDCTVRLWDVISGNPLEIFHKHLDYVRSVAFSPCGNFVASASDDGTGLLWNIGVGSYQKLLSEDDHRIWCVAFDPEGQMVACGIDGGVVKIIRLSDQSLVSSIATGTSLVAAIAFSPNGQLLAECGGDCDVRLWDVRTNQSRVLSGHTSRVWSLAFSRSGSRLLSCSEDETVRVWDVSTGNLLHTLRALRPYEGLDISGAKGLLPGERDMLLSLGAIAASPQGALE